METRVTRSAVLLRARSTFLIGILAGVLLVGAILPAVVDDDGAPASVVTGPASGAGITGDDRSGTAGTGDADLNGVPGDDGSGAAAGGIDDGGPAGSTSGEGAATPTPSGAGGGSSGSGGGSSGSGGSGRSGGSGGGGGPLTASDRGVSATTIKVGALVLDVATVGRLGVGVAINPEQQCRAYAAFFSDINERGGIQGRKIEGHCEAFDVTNTDDQIRACRALTQDRKVFAVLGGFNTVVPNLCIVDENRTPLIAHHNNFPDWVFARSHGLLATLYQRSGRHMDSVSAEMVRLGLAKKRIGILTDGLNDPNAHVMKQLEERLKARGASVVYKGQLAADIPTASSQVPVEVQKARTAQAEVIVFLASNAVYGTTFVSQAEEQGYRPTYLTTDWASNNGDSTNQNMPRSYEGAIGITTSHSLSSEMQPAREPRQAAACRQRYDKHAGEKLPPGRDGESNTTYGSSMSICDVVRIFEALAVAAGPNLTRASLMGALPSVSGFEAASWGGGSFGASKHDFADLVRTQRWNFACKCWHRGEDFHRPGG